MEEPQTAQPISDRPSLKESLLMYVISREADKKHLEDFCEKPERGYAKGAADLSVSLLGENRNHPSSPFEDIRTCENKCSSRTPLAPPVPGPETLHTAHTAVLGAARQPAFCVYTE